MYACAHAQCAATICYDRDWSNIFGDIVTVILMHYRLPYFGDDLRQQLLGLVVSQSPANIATSRIWVHHVVCLFTPQLSLVLVALTYGRMARLKRPQWLVLRRYCRALSRAATYPDANRTRRNATSMIMTIVLPLSQTATICRSHAPLSTHRSAAYVLTDYRRIRQLLCPRP